MKKRNVPLMLLFLLAVCVCLLPAFLNLPVPALAAGVAQAALICAMLFAAVKSASRRTAAETEELSAEEPAAEALPELSEDPAVMEQLEKDESEDYQSLVSGLSSDLFNDSKLIEVYNHQLGEVIQTTDTAAENLIESFMGINAAVKKLTSIVKTLLSLGKQSDEGIQGNVLLEMKDVIRQITGSFSKTKDIIERNYVACMRYDNHISTIGKTIPMINEIIEKMKVLSINASIEAARAGNAGSGFKIVANEFRALTDKFNHSKETIENTISEAASFSEEIYASSRETELQFLDVFEDSLALLDNISDTISSKISESTKMAMSAYELSRIISSDVQKIVVSIQFQDITRQRIEHVQIPLKELSKTLNSVGEMMNEKIAQHIQLDDQKIEKYKELFSMRSERDIFMQHFGEKGENADA